MENYALEILIIEKKRIENCVKDWELTKYPEARKLRVKRIEELSKAILLIENM